MKNCIVRFVFSLLAVVLFCGLPAPAQIATLTCQTAQGGTLTAPVFGFLFEFFPTILGNISIAELAVGIDSLPALFASESASTTYTSCSVANGASVTFADASLGGALPYGIGPGVPNSETSTSTSPLLYALVALKYDSLTTGGITVPVFDPSASAAGRKVLNQARQHADAALKARLGASAQRPILAVALPKSTIF